MWRRLSSLRVLVTFQSPLSCGWNTGQEYPANRRQECLRYVEDGIALAVSHFSARYYYRGERARGRARISSSVIPHLPTPRLSQATTELTPLYFRHTIASVPTTSSEACHAAGFYVAFARLKQLVADFGANGKFHLSPQCHETGGSRNRVNFNLSAAKKSFIQNTRC